MIAEAVTIGAILGGCAITAWFAKIKFQPGIDRSLARIEEKEAIVARRRSSRNA